MTLDRPSSPAFETRLPGLNERLRERLYAGQLFKFGATKASLGLSEEVLGLLSEHLGRGLAPGMDPRDMHPQLSELAFFEGVGRVRKILYMDDHFHRRLLDVVAAAGFDPERTVFDPLRLRTVCHDGHHNPRAAALYVPHRDTWYGHPDALIGWWIPLDDLGEEETFEFYPSQLTREVPNDSERFVYDEWVARGWSLKIGWQDIDAGLRTTYPGAQLERPEDAGAPLRFSARKGENLLFAGAHLHKTRPQSTGRTRFSLDFRVLDLPDFHAGKGAPNVDNRSVGAGLKDYVACHS